MVLFVTEKYDKRKVSLCFFSFRVLFACPNRTKRTKRGKYSSFKHLLSPRGDSCEQSAPTVPQLLNHGYRFETLKRRLGFTAVPCWATANLAGIDRFAQANAVGVAETGWLEFGCVSGCEHCEIKFALHNTHVTPHPPLSRSPFSHWRRLIVTSVSALTLSTPAPLFSAGVRTMRARICSAFSCDMFARVVCWRLWGAAKLPIFAFIPCRTHLPRMARATNSCTRGEFSKRGESSL